MLALFSQTWHWELLFTWPSASTQKKAVYSVYELAPPVLFILGGIILPTFLGNGYFQADGRSCRKLWSRLMWEPLDLIDTRHLWSSVRAMMSWLLMSLKLYPPLFFPTVLLQHLLFSLLRQKCSGECLGVYCSRRRHGARMTFLGEFWGQHSVTPCWSFKGRGLSPIAADSNRSFSVTSLVGNLAARVMAGVSCVHCLKAVSISNPTEANESLGIDLTDFGWGPVWLLLWLVYRYLCYLMNNCCSGDSCDARLLILE